VGGGGRAVRWVAVGVGRPYAPEGRKDGEERR
jgi:hypothetical protein